MLHTSSIGPKITTYATLERQFNFSHMSLALLELLGIQVLAFIHLNNFFFGNTWNISVVCGPSQKDTFGVINYSFLKQVRFNLKLYQKYCNIPGISLHDVSSYQPII